MRDMLALDAHRLDELTAVGIASVVPPLTERFVGFAQDRLGLEPMVVDAATLKGILPIEIDRPAEAGADRLCNAGRRDRVRRPGDRHRPGHQHELRRDRRQWRLHRRGHRPRTRRLAGGAGRPGQRLPRIELRRPEHAIGANTIDAMQSGAVLGHIGLVSGLLTALRAS